MIIILLQVLVYLFLPYLLMRASKTVKIIDFLSPAFFCYALGIVFGNIPGLHLHEGTSHQFLNITVVLAIPMLVFSAQPEKWLKLAGKTLVSWAFFLLGLSISAVIAVSVFKQIMPEVAGKAGMAMAVYTGGTPNLAAVNHALGMDKQIFVEMNLTDLMLSGIYLVFMLSLAQKLFSQFLPAFSMEKTVDSPADGTQLANASQPIWMQVLKNVGVSLVILLISVGLSFLFYGEMNDMFMIISITLLGLGSAFLPFVRKLPLSYESGEYLFLIFCVAAGSMVNLNSLVTGVPQLIGFMAIIVYGALVFHTLFCYLFKIDADTAIITTAAGVCGPPFIGPVASALKNREIVPLGMTLGVIGLGLGNLVGISVAWLVETFLL